MAKTGFSRKSTKALETYVAERNTVKRKVRRVAKKTDEKKPDVKAARRGTD